MSGKITSYGSLTSVQPDDVLPIVDVHDTTMAASGTTKKVTAGALTGITVMVPAPAGATATDTPAVTAAITRLVSALASGPATLLFGDGTYVIDSNSAVIRSVSNFTVRSAGRTVIAQAPNRSALPNNTTGDLFVIADCADFRVEGITFDGNRDTVSPITPLTAAVTAGTSSCTVAAGQGSRYVTGQHVYVFGGLGTSEQNQADPSAISANTNPFTIQSITPGGGASGGDLITFTASFNNSYTHVSSTAFSDGYGPYAYAGAYISSYQAGNATVAGRTLTGEDQQNGLHLLSCQRFVINRVTSRNLWESPIRLGSGYETTSLTDGCSQGTVADCTGYHAYDQGVAAWVSRNITVTGCVMNATGWAGISFTASDYCSAVGNQVLNSVYRAPGDNANGNGIITEGGLRNLIKDNVIVGVNNNGIQLLGSPMPWGLTGALPTTSTFLEAGTAAGTSVQVSSTANMITGGLYSILDGPYTEAVTVQSIVDGTHVTFTEKLSFSHLSGVSIGSRCPQENVIEGNTVRNPGGIGIQLLMSVRSIVKNNTVTGCGSTSVSLDYTNGFYPASAYPRGDATTIEGCTIGNGNGAAIKANGCTRLQVRGNRIYSPNGSGGGCEFHGVTDSSFIANHVTDIIGSSGFVAENGGPSNTPCARLVITGNVVERTTAFAGINVQVGDSLTITANEVRSCGGNAGIDLAGVTRSVVAANISNSNNAAGIILEDNGTTYSQYNRVIGNTCRDDGTGFGADVGGAWHQQNGILETGHSDFNTYTGNEADSNAVAQLTTAGTHSSAYANLISGALTGTPPGTMGLLATTATNNPSGVALINGTQTLLSWTAPSDGQMHRVLIMDDLHVTSATTGGQINLSFTNPAGTTKSTAWLNGTKGVDDSASDFAQWQQLLVGSGGNVTLTQGTAMTAGAATYYAEFWGA